MHRFVTLLISTAAAAALQTQSVSARADEAVDLDVMQAFGDTRYHRLDAGNTDRTYHILVRLPESYSESTTLAYPTVYLLDGGLTFPMLAGYYSYLNMAEEAPDMILVGISYGTNDWRQGNARSTDFTAPSSEREHWGGAGKFQTMLRDELMPLVESTYRSDASRRIVFGHSLGGQYVLFAAQTEPGLFWGHIASNPALHRNLDFFLDVDRRLDETRTESVLVVAAASNDAERFRIPARKWIAHWTAKDHTPWDLTVVTLEGHSHRSSVPAAFRAGVKRLFPR